MINNGYLYAGVVLVAFYAGSAWMGYEWFSYGRETAQQAQARHLAGGHRSSGGWFFFRGGK